MAPAVLAARLPTMHVARDFLEGEASPLGLSQINRRELNVPLCCTWSRQNLALIDQYCGASECPVLEVYSAHGPLHRACSRIFGATRHSSHRRYLVDACNILLGRAVALPGC